MGSMVHGIENVGRFARRLGGGMFPKEIPVGIVKLDSGVHKVILKAVTSTGTVPGVNQPLYYLTIYSAWIPTLLGHSEV